MQRANLQQAVDFVAKPELGTKRVCPTTGRKFYDLGKDPIVSPYTGMVVPVAPVVLSRAAARAEAKAATVEETTEEVATEEEGDVEIISLEEADEDETETGQKAAEGDEDIEIEEIPGTDEDDDAFLEEDEDEEVDASDLIDGELPGEEEA